MRALQAGKPTHRKCSPDHRSIPKTARFCQSVFGRILQPRPTRRSRELGSFCAIGPPDAGRAPPDWLCSALQTSHFKPQTSPRLASFRTTGSPDALSPLLPSFLPQKSRPPRATCQIHMVPASPNRVFGGASPEYQNTRIPHMPETVFWVFRARTPSPATNREFLRPPGVAGKLGLFVQPARAGPRRQARGPSAIRNAVTPGCDRGPKSRNWLCFARWLHCRLLLQTSNIKLHTSYTLPSTLAPCCTNRAQILCADNAPEWRNSSRPKE